MDGNGEVLIGKILAHFPLESLAERTYNSMSFVRRLLVKIRDLRAEIATSGDREALDRALWMRDEYHSIIREWTTMCQYWYNRVRSLERASAEAQASLKCGIQDAERSHQDQVGLLQNEISRLKVQLQSVERAKADAEAWAKENRLDAGELTDFFMSGPNEITVFSSWKRLADLFEHFESGIPPPAGWQTHINVLALNDPSCTPAPYQKPAPRKPSGGGLPASFKKKTAVLDLARSGGTKSSNSQKRKSSSNKAESQSKRKSKKTDSEKPQ